LYQLSQLVVDETCRNRSIFLKRALYSFNQIK